MQVFGDGSAEMTFESASFDVVLCVEAAMHFRTRLRFFQEAYRLLKPGGTLILTDMLIGDRESLKQWHVPEENYLIEVDVYRRHMTEAGFKNVNIQDERDLCWCRWCDSLTAWLASDSPMATSQESLELRRIGIEQQRPLVTSYLLVSAMKP